MSTIEALGDDLLKAYEGRGLTVTPNLAPGLTADAYAAAIGVAVDRLPPALLDLYAWRNGCDEDADAQLLFRDDCFLSAERAAAEWTRAHPYLGPDVLGFDPADAIPVAAYEGSLHVVVFGPHPFGEALTHPVVSIYQSVEAHFTSIAAMLQTCADWVRHPSWDPEQGLDDEEAELTLWRRHNPELPLFA